MDMVKKIISIVFFFFLIFISLGSSKAKAATISCEWDRYTGCKISTFSGSCGSSQIPESKCSDYGSSSTCPTTINCIDDPNAADRIAPGTCCTSDNTCLYSTTGLKCVPSTLASACATRKSCQVVVNYGCSNPPCTTDEVCTPTYPGGAEVKYICVSKYAPTPSGNSIDVCDDGSTGIQTAIGCIHVLNTPEEFLSDILRWAVGIGGGIAFLLILYAGFMIMTASGNPERIKAGQELLTSAIGGLILLVFSIFILKFIGIDIMGLDKFGFGSASTTSTNSTCVVNNVCKNDNQSCCSGNSRSVSGALCPSGQQCIP